MEDIIKTINRETREEVTKCKTGLFYLVCFAFAVFCSFVGYIGFGSLAGFSMAELLSVFFL